jgi:betaine-aldehyde dehydrogenase
MSDPKQLSQTIGGRPAAARDGRVFEAVNPATGEVIATIPRGGAADVDDAVVAAEQALPQWRAATPGERAGALVALAQLIEDNATELALLDVADNGSPIREMRADAYTAAKSLRFFAGLTLQLQGQTIPGGWDRLNYTLRQPYGVVGRIVPFNHPFMFAASKIAAPLAAGNTVVLKPSEHTSVSATRLGELSREVLPDGVLNIVTGFGDEAGDAIVTHPRIRRLAFIGSVEIGRAIQARAASVAVKTVTLELGGKNPLVIFPDADLELAISGALRGMNFTWQGQSCGSTSRLLVHRSIHDEFVAALAARIDGLKSGPPAEESTDTGAIVHRRQFEKVLAYLQIGRDEGARVVAGGGVADDPELAAGMYLRPTLFDNVDPASRLANEEIFGPVLAAMPFDDYDEALSIANRVSYGLTAGVFTGDLALAHRFARDVEAGYVWVNDTSAHFAGAPYGGYKDSGVGREESMEELESYAQIKNVNVRF